ncbi:hypothetical protein [Pseudoalteromonas obscura]|uniref:Uncharacterized protein n=1 Tax=Pseudoalteromonas obscura TaxID=3048491 RepID=A0ABT7EFB0_9GAMM|nr:hypothetical protein [Pseudoalteromonas sp. P94(2023)]MDK2593962.1 hypothetical protein [Pseudoalteromonas sp. P94(2023)]
MNLKKTNLKILSATNQLNPAQTKKINGAWGTVATVRITLPTTLCDPTKTVHEA